MKTVFFALALALAMPIGAQEPMTYARLCGATEGSGDNNDFCALWAQNNWQGMRHALSISIRTARAQENRNRFYFDHKRGATRGAFIQLKRPWMGDDWHVRHTYDIHDETNTRETTLAIYNIQCGLDSWCVRVDLVDDPVPSSLVQGYEAGFQRVTLTTREDAVVWRISAQPSTSISWIDVRRFVECGIDDYGWHIGEVEVRPDCTQSDGYPGRSSSAGDMVPANFRYAALAISTAHNVNGIKVVTYANTAAEARSESMDWCEDLKSAASSCRVIATFPTANVGKPYCWAYADSADFRYYGVGSYNDVPDSSYRQRAERAAIEDCRDAGGSGCAIEETTNGNFSGCVLAAGVVGEAQLGVEAR